MSKRKIGEVEIPEMARQGLLELREALKSMSKRASCRRSKVCKVVVFRHKGDRLCPNAKSVRGMSRRWVA
jgi:hypothetical protein